MLIKKNALIFFAIAIKINWVLMVLFYHPLLLLLCLMMSIGGLFYFFKKRALPFITVAMIGWFMDCVWHTFGIIDFSNTQFMPLFLFPIWLTYSVFIVYFFDKLKKYAYLMPIVFSCLNVISYAIGIRLGDSIANTDLYYLITILAWIIMGGLIIWFKPNIQGKIIK